MSISDYSLKSFNPSTAEACKRPVLEMSDDDASYMLASWAKQFTGVLLEICLKMRKKLPKDVLRKAGEIATRLRMVCPYIESLPRYWIETDVDQLCREILKHLVTISMVRLHSSLQPVPIRLTISI